MEEDELAELYEDQYEEDVRDDGMQEDLLPGQAVEEDEPSGLPGPGQDDKSLHKKLMDSLVEANKWRSAFKEVAGLVGFSAAARDPDIQGVLETVQRLKLQGQTMQEELRELRRKEAALQIALSDRSLELAELRRELVGAWACSDPCVAQLRHLHLDPAVNREFVRMRGELDDAQRELRRMQEELAAASFTQESKVGRQLMAKCRALADENEEMGREAGEGKVHALEAQLVLAKGFTEDMRTQVSEMLDHCGALNEEVEELQREVFSLRRKVKEYEGRDGPPGDFMQGRRMMGPGGDMGSHGHMGMHGGMGGPMQGGRGGPVFRGGRSGFRGGRGGRFGGLPPPPMRDGMGGGRGQGGMGPGGGPGMMQMGGGMGQMGMGPPHMR